MVFDLNDLKVINDTQGHEAGDQYILDSCRLICGLYAHSPVYRIGGDEFTVILQGHDYNRRDELYRSFEKAVDENVQSGSPIVISSGMAIYDKGPDRSVEMVFERADENMYLRKKVLKEKAKFIVKQGRE